MGVTLPFLQSPGTLSEYQEFLNTVESVLTVSTNSLVDAVVHFSGTQDAVVHFSGTHRLMDVQFPQMVTNLISAYSRMGTAQPISTF